MAGSSANRPGTAPGSVQPGAGINALNGPTSGATGGNFFSGLAKAPPSFMGQLAMGALSGVGQAYQANLQNKISQGQLNIANERQNNANSQVASGGIINNARKNSNTGS